MDTVKLAGFAVCAALLALAVRRMRPEMGGVVALAAGVMAALLLLPALAEVVDGVTALARSGGVSQGYMALLMKVAGISLLMDFAAQTCRDAGEEGLAMKTELAGRIMLLTLALPAMQTLLRQILSLAP